jgi:hypothetical protein
MRQKKIRQVVGEIDVKSNGFIQLAKGPFTASDLKSVMKSNVIIRNVRANIINNALWMEDFLDDIIEKVLFPGRKRLVFRDSIYEDLRFRKKGDIFRSIIRNKIVSLDKPDEVIRQIQEIITIRNDFAHGKVFFRRRKMFLETLKGKEIELSDSYFVRANHNFRKARDALSHILRELKPR